jgi:hypothetical protein
MIFLVHCSPTVRVQHTDCQLYGDICGEYKIQYVAYDSQKPFYAKLDGTLVWIIPNDQYWVFGDNENDEFFAFSFETLACPEFTNDWYIYKNGEVSTFKILAVCQNF